MSQLEEGFPRDGLPFGRKRHAAWNAITNLRLDPDERLLLELIFERAWPDYADGKSAGPQLIKVKMPELETASGLPHRRFQRVRNNLVRKGLLLEQRRRLGIAIELGWRAVFGISPDRTSMTGVEEKQAAGTSPLTGCSDDEQQATGTNNQSDDVRELLLLLIREQHQLKRDVLALRQEVADLAVRLDADESVQTHSGSVRTVIEHPEVLEHSAPCLSVVDGFSNKKIQQQQTTQVFEHPHRVRSRRAWTLSLAEDRAIFCTPEHCQDAFETLQQQGWISPEDREDWFAFWSWLSRSTLKRPWGLVNKRVRDGTWRDVVDEPLRQSGKRLAARLEKSLVESAESDSAQCDRELQKAELGALEERYGALLDSMPKDDVLELAARLGLNVTFIKRFGAGQVVRPQLLKGIAGRHNDKGDDEKNGKDP